MIAQSTKYAVPLSLTLLTLFAFSNSSLQSQSPQSNPRKSSASADAPKVWTNDNLATLKGGISVVGNGVSASKTRRFNLPDGEQADDIYITSPSDGAVVHPGDTISVEVEVASGVKALSGVAVVSPIDTGMQLKTSPPYTFSLKIPESDAPAIGGLLLGQQSIIALGARAGHQPLASAPVTVDVEKLGLPISLVPQFKSLDFHSVGESLPLIMLATFPDHSVFDVRDSTYLSFDSTNRAVATVDAYGVVTAAGPGTGSIVVTYSVVGKCIETKIPVTFRTAISRP